MAKNDKKPPATTEAQIGANLDIAPVSPENAGPAPEDAAEDGAATQAADKQAAEAESTEGLVKMHKDGEHLHVHPTTVKAHEQAGWKVA